MDYGTGAIFGCPSGDQRDLEFARKYGLPVVPVVMPKDADAASFKIGETAYHRRRRDDQFALPGRPGHQGRLRGGGQAPGEREARQKAGRPAQGQLPPARLGHLPAALLGLPDPGNPLRGLRRGACAGRGPARDACPRMRPSTCRATRWTGIRRGSTSPARPAASRRGARRTPWIRSSTAPGISCASLPRTPTRRSARKRPTTGCPWTSTSAASSTRSCTCSIRASSPAPWAPPAISRRRLKEPFAALFTQGMVTHETYRTRNGQWVPPSEVRIEGEGDTRQAFDISTNQPVEIGSIEKMSKSKKNIVDLDDFISQFGADTARWFVLSDSPPERDVIYTDVGVQGARRFVQRAVADGRGLRGVRRQEGSAPTGQIRPGGGPVAPGRAQGAEQRWRKTSRPCGSTWRWPRSTSSPIPCRP